MNVSKPVIDLQQILLAIGVPEIVVTPDGLFGPKTADAWGIVATSLGLDGRFERVDAHTARVSSAAYDRLLREATVRKAPAPSGGDAFMKLNNAIARAAFAGPGFAKLASDWADEVYEERSWKIAIPPLWASLLMGYWERYRELYYAAPAKTELAIVPPEYLKPGGSIAAFKDLWEPAFAAAGDTYDRAVERVQATLRQAGHEVAVGARQESLDWALGAAAGAGLLAILWVATRDRKGAQMGDWRLTEGDCDPGGKYPCDAIYESDAGERLALRTTRDRRRELPARAPTIARLVRLPGIQPGWKVGRAGFGGMRRGPGAPEHDPAVRRLRDESIRAHSAWWHAQQAKAPRARVRAARKQFRAAALAFRRAWDDAERRFLERRPAA